MTHEAGWAHAPGALRGPAWLREPTDPNALVPHLWSTTAHKNADGELTVGGVTIPELVAEVNTPAYVLDEADFRARARAFREASPTTTSSTPARRSSAPRSRTGSPRRGSTSTSAPRGELTVALRAGFDPARIGYHGNNKTARRAAPRGRRGVGRIVLDSFVEIERLAEITAELGRTAAGHGAGDRGRRGAHPRVHRHRPRGPEVRPLDHLRRRLGGRTPRAGRARPGAARPALPHRQPDLRLVRASRWPPAGCWRCTPGSATSSA